MAPMISPNALADFPGRNGRITFMQADDAGYLQVWVAPKDHLSRSRQITHKAAGSGWPVWSPTAPLIAFDSDRTDPDTSDEQAINDVFVIRPDGTGTRKVTDSVGFSSDPGWAPRGKRIAFSGDRGDYPASQGIYTIRPDSTHLRRVTTLPEGANVDTAPRFSPNGKRLVFTRYANEGDAERGALFTVRLDGTRERRITPEKVSAGDADWSPNGRWLVFEADTERSTRGGVFKIRPNGNRLRNLTDNDGRFAGSSDPVWSPNGKKILFLSGKRATEENNFRFGLTTMRPDGSHRHFISRQEQEQPDWQSR